MYNDYYYNNNMGNSMMWQGLPKKHFSWNNILNNTQRTLGIINQAIPLIYQVRPLVTNAGFKHLQNIKTVETIEKWLFFCQIFIFHLA